MNGKAIDLEGNARVAKAQVLVIQNKHSNFYACPTESYIIRPLMRLSVPFICVETQKLGHIGEDSLEHIILRNNTKTIIISSFDAVGDPFASYARLGRVKSIKPDIKIVAVWWDTCHEGISQQLEAPLGIIDEHILTDNPLMLGIETKTKQDIRFRPLRPLRDNLDNSWHKTIDICFFGQATGKRNNRQSLLSRIARHKEISSYISPLHGFLDDSRVIATMQRSILCLNLPSTVRYPQLKGRMWESIEAGCVFLTPSSDIQTKALFNAGEHYLSFDDERDLFRIIDYYTRSASGQTEARAIARKMKDHADRLMNCCDTLQEIIAN